MADVDSNNSGNTDTLVDSLEDGAEDSAEQVGDECANGCGDKAVLAGQAPNLASRVAQLTDKQLRALPLAVAGVKFRDIARIVGVHHNTLSAWMSDDVYRAEYDRLRGEMYENTIQHTITTMRDILDNADSPIAVKAGDSLLKHHAAIVRTNSAERATSTLLDKLLQAATSNQPAIEAEYTVIADTDLTQSMLPEPAITPDD